MSGRGFRPSLVAMSGELLRFQYEHTSSPGPNAPLLQECSGCGSMAKTGGWTEREWQPKERRYRAITDLDLCDDCAAEVEALEPGHRYVPAPKRTREPHRERALVVAFMLREADTVRGLLTEDALRLFAARIQRGEHREAKRGTTAPATSPAPKSGGAA